MSQTSNPCMVFETYEYISQIYILAGIYIFNNQKLTKKYLKI